MEVKSVTTSVYRMTYNNNDDGNDDEWVTSGLSHRWCAIETNKHWAMESSKGGKEEGNVGAGRKRKYVGMEGGIRILIGMLFSDLKNLFHYKPVSLLT